MNSPAYRLDFPESLPVSARRQEIMDAIAAHPVVIVCGETGSGKTTQLPKMALALGRGGAAPQTGQKSERRRWIGHTQPRRIAATSVAKRIAEELQTPLGEVVGYKVRFQDRLTKGASIKLMTDGILLAETQTDPLLKAYDTLIIDEAHERSLNIDFLLGYLKQILPQRPDLKIIVTSATIDAERFAHHFNFGGKDAPVIMVSGRTYPVEIRYRPVLQDKESDLNTAIADAVDELWRSGQGGDILVFLPGEREIRDAADHLRGHLSHTPLGRSAEVLPMFARLSQAEQERVFSPSNGRRIVLATNVAETSLTVPGIRYVIDSGTARTKRYSLRSKVEQLLVEPISQAAAQQRSGRCGRVAEGVCIRLYEEADFAARAPFTDPEILRSSLAAVILRMKALHLADVDRFPFIEAPSSRAIADGYQLLTELGAVDEQLALTPLGQALSRLPLDPRVARMMVEARDRQALAEVLVVASALSVQDVRDRPLQAQAQADQAHAQFDDEKSEFNGYLRLWQWLHDARGGEGKTHKLSHRQYEALLRQKFINVRRVREWRDTYSQLHTVVTEHGWRINTSPATYEQLHLSLLSGLLGNVGCKQDEQDVYLGARGIKFHRHPGAHLSKKPGRWIVAAELVETTRLFARGMAHIEPQWLEQVGAHVLKKQLLDPHWQKKSAEVVALERATLYGLVVYSARPTAYSRVDPEGAREIFIRSALVQGDWETPLPFLAANLKTVAQVEELEHKSRRQDVLVDDELIYAFYDQQLPADVLSGKTLEAWYRQTVKTEPKLLLLSRQELMRHEAAGITTEAFPRTVKLGGVDCSAEYLHEPGHARDGLTVTVPLFVLNQVSPERCEWLVPGLLKEKIQALLKSLPQKPRSRYVPLPQSAERLAALYNRNGHFGQGALTDQLLKTVREETSLDVKRSDFKLDMLPAHLFMNLRLVDEHGRQLAMGRNLGAIKSDWGAQARGAFSALAQLKVTAQSAQEAAAAVESEPKGRAQVSSGQGSATSPHEPRKKAVAQGAQKTAQEVRDADQLYTEWSFGELPELLEVRKGRQTLIGFPALVDAREGVRIEVFDEPETATAQHRQGLKRLVALHIKDALKYLEKNIPDLQKMAVAYMPLGSHDELRAQIVDLALERAFLQEPWPVDATAFETRLKEGRTRLNLIAQEVARLGLAILLEYAAAQRKIKDSKMLAEASADATEQLQRLMPKKFLMLTPWAVLQHFPRYLKAIALRLDKARSDPVRDSARLIEIKTQEQRYWRLVAERKGVQDARMHEFRWLLEELRVSFYAQELRTPQPVSVKRLEKLWLQVHQ